MSAAPTAVMASRKEPHGSLDFFPTRAWATRALCEGLATDFEIGADSVWEPACGEGHMSRPLAEYFACVRSSDVHDYGFGEVLDFLSPWIAVAGARADWIITNPPFRLAGQFIATALERARYGVAMFVRTAFLESRERYETLFRDRPPSEILQFSERVPLHRGRVEENGATATAYCWIVWRRNGSKQTSFRWIAPCRARLERASDYADAPLGAPAAAPLFGEVPGFMEAAK